MRLSATPSFLGWHFLGWLGDSDINSPIVDIKMNQDKPCTSCFWYRALHSHEWKRFGEYYPFRCTLSPWFKASYRGCSLDGALLHGLDWCWER